MTEVASRGRPLDNVKLHFVDNIDTAYELLRWLSTEDAKDVIAIDTEGTGLDKHGKDFVRMAQVGGCEHGWAIPWDGWWGVFADVVKRYEGTLALHNAPYDVTMLDKAGVKLPRNRIRDTRLMSHIIDPIYSTALKNQAGKYIDPRASSAQKGLDDVIGSRGGWTWATVPVDYQPYWAYAAVDTVLTRHLHDHHYPRVMAEAPYAWEIESAVQWVLLGMEQRGVHVDTKYARIAKERFDEYCDQVEKWCRRTYDVSPGSNAAIIKILHAEGVEFTKRTEKGAFSLDKEVLEQIDHPLAQSVFRRRQLQKLSSTYLSHFIDEIDAEGLIHPDINQLGARTSRMSMAKPNFQNLPRIGTSKPGDEVRRSVDTRYGDGGTLLFCDFDQIEMRTIADMADEPRMIEAFKSEGDFFVNLARQIFNDPTIEKSDKRRQITKNAGYATIFGAGTAKFSWTAGIPETYGAEFMLRWNRFYPALRRHSMSVTTEATRRRLSEGVPYVRCPITGRKQVADPGKEYALVNYKVQGAAASILKIKILEMAAAGLDEWMVIPIHDEIMLDVPSENVTEAADALKSIMNDDKLLKVPITASVSHGKRWGDKEEYEWPSEEST